MQVQSTIKWKISTFYCMYEYEVIGTLMKNICDGSDWGFRLFELILCMYFKSYMCAIGAGLFSLNDPVIDKLGSLSCSS
jgi:hypothetical protein